MWEDRLAAFAAVEERLAAIEAATAEYGRLEAVERRLGYQSPRDVDARVAAEAARIAAGRRIADLLVALMGDEPWLVRVLAERPRG